MTEGPILERIDALVDEVNGLWAQSGQRELDEAAHGRLVAIREEFDRYWDLLHRRPNPGTD